MTNLFKKAVEKVERLPNSQQDGIAAIILDVLADEERWTRTFAETPDVLDRLAREAEQDEQDEQDEHARRTMPLDPDNM